MARLDPESLRAYARRDWRVVDRQERAPVGTPEDRLAVSERLAAEAVALHPGWPDAAERARDLASHQRTSALLRRAFVPSAGGR